MDARKRRIRGHILADIAVRHVEYVAALAGYVTTSFPSGGDYGIDLALHTFDDSGYLENEHVKVQVKAQERCRPSKDGSHIALPIDRRDLDHWLREPVPVILVLHDVSAATAAWVYVQRYFERLPGFSLQAAGQTTTIRVPMENRLDVPAMRQFREFKRAVLAQTGKVSHA